MRTRWGGLINRRYTRWMKTIHDLLIFDKSQVAQYRLMVLEFWKAHGIKATIEAYQVSKTTLYDWRKILNQSQGKTTSLIPKSTRPKKVRSMMVD
jgi:hypothetical protein